MLRVDNVTKDYTGKRALDNVSLEVPRGSVYGLLGPNGAGKTTLIRIINHITMPDTGTVTFDGHRLCADDVRRIGYLPEERGLYKKMRVGEQAVFLARLRGLTKGEAEKRLRWWFQHLGISDWWGKKVQELSKGMQQKVQFIVTVLHEPQLLIFDEPFSGFDPINAQLLKDEILRLRDQGATVIFSTHNMSSVEEICDHITLINDGCNVLTGKVDDVRRQYCDRMYDIDWRPGTGDLAAALAHVTESFAPEGNGHARVRLLPDTPLRDAITLANDAVELQSVTPALASMNDIFIQAVNQSNAVSL